MAVFVCEEIRPIQNLDAYLARKDELLFYGSSSWDKRNGILFKSTGNHLLIFSIQTPDKSSDKYRFNFLEYLSEIEYVASLDESANKIRGTKGTENFIIYISNQDKVWYGDNLVSSLIARMTLANKYDLKAITDRFNTKCSNYSFSWDYPMWDIPVLGEYQSRKEHIGVLLHMDKNGSISMKPSENNIVLEYNSNKKNSRKVLCLDCTLRRIFRSGFITHKKFTTGISPYSIDRYRILYDALISVFNIELIDKER